jgi:ABC-type glutathione transport system ATPase component
VCTDIIHYEKRQLRRYKGNLSEFVKQVPAAKSYYELEAASLKFRFPTPGLLDGISSKEKPICKLSNVVFTYPGATVPQLTDVNVAARLSSRVAVIGVNGAGKSVSDGCTWQLARNGVLLLISCSLITLAQTVMHETRILYISWVVPSLQHHQQLYTPLSLPCPSCLDGLHTSHCTLRVSLPCAHRR